MGLNTREKKLNTYTQNNDSEILYSNVDTVLYDNEVDLTLINYNDFILKKGSNISNDISLDPNKEYEIYGHPEKWQLDYKQQFNNCGVESVMNIAAISGTIDISEETWTEYIFTYNALIQNLCRDKNHNGLLDKEDGGTTAEDRENLLKENGINSTHSFFTDLSSIGNMIKEGKGVIIRVASNILWDNYFKDKILNHAIAVVCRLGFNPTELKSKNLVNAA